ncbi:hypothetical protein CRE_17002 [Caenorhabditis remanei]|uniref:Uncharacterized protein n=1 Tax=Caenorhabditis remanei TaxID=31234 RepID=E3N7X3_CAERE|nr:hypothetical protein CRE_17002 [Caenorhabditis remanei]
MDKFPTCLIATYNSSLEFQSISQDSHASGRISPDSHFINQTVHHLRPHQKLELSGHLANLVCLGLGTSSPCIRKLLGCQRINSDFK